MIHVDGFWWGDNLAKLLKHQLAVCEACLCMNDTADQEGQVKTIGQVKTFEGMSVFLDPMWP